MMIPANPTQADAPPGFTLVTVPGRLAGSWRHDYCQRTYSTLQRAMRCNDAMVDLWGQLQVSQGVTSATLAQLSTLASSYQAALAASSVAHASYETRLVALEAGQSSLLAGNTRQDAELAALRAKDVAESAAIDQLTGQVNADGVLLGQLQALLAQLQAAEQADATAITALQGQIATLNARRARGKSVAVPGMTLTLGTASVDLTVTWPFAWPDTAYDVLCSVEAPASLLGKTSWTVKSKTATAAIVTVTTTSVIAAGTTSLRAISYSTSGV